ncbi:hypothetical protein HOY80DRAFT_1134636 [Tuber brumale]|nr:hypothetical protein HOY80DRAFT_1134636 [Tuber brumale]
MSSLSSSSYLILAAYEGFRRQDNWMKFLVGVFVTTTILVEFTYAGSRPEKSNRGGVVALESKILLELARMELGLSKNARQGWGELGIKLRRNGLDFPMVFSPNTGVFYNRKGLGKVGGGIEFTGNG